MMTRAFVLAFVAIFLAAPGASTQNQVPRTAVCTAENSERTSIAMVAADPGAWMGRCVAVEGIYSAERVYEDADAIYGVTDHSVGGFVDGLGAAPGGFRGTFVGRVSDCAVAEEILLTAQLRAPGISLHERVLGCTQETGPFLMFMSHGALEPSGLKRRLPGAKGGNLVPAPADWEHRGTMVQQAGVFALALRSGNVDAITRLLGDRYRAEQVLADEGSALARLKGVGGTPMIFMQRGLAADEAAGEACWCLTRDCAKRWPIDSRDADNQANRPYACLRIEGVRRDGAWRYRYDASHDLAGLGEP